jgi:hypothetical protein
MIAVTRYGSATPSVRQHERAEDEHERQGVLRTISV